MTEKNDSQCYFVQLQIDSYLDGEMNEPQREVFASHVHQCLACAAELRLAQSIHDAVLDLPALDCPDELLEPVYRLTRQDKQQQTGESAWQGLLNWLGAAPAMIRYAVPAAALTALVLSLAPALTLNEQPQPAVAVQTATGEPEYTPEEVVAALRDLNTAINYMNEVSERTEVMIGDRFIVSPLQETLNASFEHLLDDDAENVSNGPI